MLTLLITISALLLLVTALVVVLRQKRQLAQQIAAMQEQLNGLCAAAVGSDERMVQFEQHLHKIREYQNTLDMNAGPARAYEHAIRLARKGGGVAQLIDNCNLSDEEAQLICRLHGQSDQLQQSDVH